MTTLTLEVLNGPLDGAEITINSAAEWTRQAGSPLAFPWDDELGEPQARFAPAEAGSWTLEGLAAPHGTYVVNRGLSLGGQCQPLQEGDLLRAHRTWLVVKSIK